MGRPFQFIPSPEDVTKVAHLMAQLVAMARQTPHLPGLPAALIGIQALDLWVQRHTPASIQAKAKISRPHLYRLIRRMRAALDNGDLFAAVFPALSGRAGRPARVLPLVQAAYQALYRELGRIPLTPEIAARCGVGPRQVRRLLADRRHRLAFLRLRD